MIHAVIVGNIGQEPELRSTAGGMSVLRLRVAANNRQQVDGEWRDVPTWVSVDLVGKRAESLSKVAQKGTRVAVRGVLYQREYARKDGSKGLALDCRADDVELLGGGKPAGEARPAPRAERPEFDHDHTYSMGFSAGNDDGSDIPF